MTLLHLYISTKGFTRDRRGQDLIEYALLGATFAVVAGAIFPPSIMPGVSAIFSKVVSCFNAS